MAKFKDFGGSTNETAEPISFKIFDEEFSCIPKIQGKVLLNMVSNSNSDDPAASASVITEFFSAVLKEESLERFNLLVEDKERIVSVETLGEIVGWLAEQYTNRPTEGSSAS
jgi:hypothetical protein